MLCETKNIVEKKQKEKKKKKNKAINVSKVSKK